MVNFIEKGDSLDTILAADTLPGVVVELGDFVGVAPAGGNAGDNVAVAYVGVFALPKAAGAGSGITQGTKVYWDNTAKQITATASTNKVAGAVWKTALDADVTVNVRLLG